MSRMLSLSTRQYGVSWPTIAALADQAVYLLWKYLFVCLWVCMLVTCYLRFVPTIFRESWSADLMNVCYQLSCTSVCAFHLSDFGPSNFYCVCCLTSKPTNMYTRHSLFGPTCPQDFHTISLALFR